MRYETVTPKDSFVALMVMVCVTVLVAVKAAIITGVSVGEVVLPVMVTARPMVDGAVSDMDEVTVTVVIVYALFASVALKRAESVPMASVLQGVLKSPHVCVSVLVVLPPISVSECVRVFWRREQSADSNSHSLCE